MRLPALAAFAVLLAPPAAAEMHEVKMLNRGEAGPMVYEPDFLRIAPGDTVKFLATHTGHNAASVEGMVPEGVEAFRGNINEEIEVTLTEEGLYGILCTPHYAMGMVMLIAVGEADPANLAMPDNVPARARQRFEEIIAVAAP